MPVGLYLDTGESVGSIRAKVRNQQVQDELPGWGQHYLNDPAIRAMRRRYGSEAYVKYLEERSKWGTQQTQEEKPFLPSNILIEKLGLKGGGVGKAAARGVVRGVLGIVDYPFALYNFIREGVKAKPNFDIVGNYKTAVKTLAQPEVATEVGVSMATGLAIGYGASRLGTRIATKRAQMKVRNMAFDKSRLYVPSPEEIMQGSPFKSLRTFKTAGGKWGITEKGVGMSITAMDKNRGFVSAIRYESGVEFGVPAKGFMPAYRAKFLRISEKPFFIQNVGKASGGVPLSRYQLASVATNFGRTARLTPKAYLAHLYKTEYPFALMSETARVAPAVHTAEAVGAFTTISPALTIQKEKEKSKVSIVPKTVHEPEELTKQKIKQAQAIGEIQKEKQKSGLTQIVTHKDRLVEQIKRELRYEEKQKQKPTTTPTPTSTPELEPPAPQPVAIPKITPTTPTSKLAEKTIQLPRLTMPQITTVKPPSLRPTRIVPPVPLRLRISPKPSARTLFARLKKVWARKVEWGDIRLFGKKDKGMGRKRKEKEKWKRRSNKKRNTKRKSKKRGR